MTMFDQLIPDLPAKGPTLAPFVASVLSRRPARGAQAAQFARSVLAQGDLLLKDSMHCLPYPKGKNALARDARKETVCATLSLEQDSLKAIAFRDCSMLLCTKEGEDWRIYPEIFAFQSTHIVDTDTQIKTRMDTPTQLNLVGDPNLAKPLEEAFWECAHWWQKHLDTLPAISYNPDGFIPSFAIIPPTSEEKTAKAVQALDALAKFILVHTDLTEVSITIPFVTPDANALTKGVQPGVHGRAATQGFYQSISKPYRDLVKNAVLAPSFPFQQMDWLHSVDVDPNQPGPHKLMVVANHQGLSAHDKLQAMADFHHYFPTMKVP